MTLTRLVQHVLAALHLPVGWTGWVTAAVAGIVLLFFWILPVVTYMIWWLRRLLGFMQSRLGPNRVGPEGLLQTPADALKLLTKEEPHENSVGFSQRSEVPIEPRLSEQWFLRYPKTKEALDVVRDHLIRFFPRHWEKVYAQWLENIRDW